MTVPKWSAIVPLAGALLAVLFLTRHCGPTPDPSAPYRAELARMQRAHAVDSAATARTVDSLTRLADSLSKVADASFHKAVQYQRDAAGLRLARLALHVVADSSPCDSALTLATREADTLRVGFDTLTAAYGTLFGAYRGAVETASAAYVGWMKAEGQLSQERAVWGEERDAWRATVKRLRPCRLLGLLPCPTVAVGWGVTLTGGRLVTGPALTVAIPLR